MAASWIRPVAPPTPAAESPSARVAPAGSVGVPAAAAEDESSGLALTTKMLIGVCGMAAIIAVCIIVWFVAIRDTWEVYNAARISAKLSDADQLQQSDPSKAYKAYDEVLNEAKKHVVTDSQLSGKLANAEKSRAALYPIVQEKIRAEEAEKKRLAEEEARRANEEKQRVAKEEERKHAAEEVRRIAAEKQRAEEERRKEAVAAYRNAPQSAKNILTTLKKLNIKIGIGINYQTYSADIENVYPDIKLFLESAESQKYPELRFFLSNAADCYLLVRDEWADSIQGEDYLNIKKYHASLFMIEAKSILWRTAAANIAGAEVLIGGNDQEIANFIQTTFPKTRHEVTLLAACLVIVKQAEPKGEENGTLFTDDNFPAGVLPRCKQQAEINEQAAEQWRELDGLLKANEVRVTPQKLPPPGL
jgi:hypothetical protein